MEISILFQGIIIGFSIAAPVGPIGVLCIRRTLSDGRAVGFISGLGAATADAFYGCVAGLGLTVISNVLVGHQLWFRLIGGLFLCFLGVKTFLDKPAEKAASATGNGLVGSYASTFFLTLTNPMTILSFAGIIMANASENSASAGVLVLGVFIGSALWWLFLSSGASLFRTRFTPRWMRWLNRISGAIIVGYGLRALLSLLG
jgi:threonine/homoserine/homoserine lactone efflux protein